MSTPIHTPNGSRSGPLGEPWAAWTALGIGVLAITAQTASSMTFAVLMKPIVEEFGWGRTDFTGAMTLRMFLMVLVVWYAGLLTDRLGARVVLAVGALIIGLGSLAISRVESLTQFYLFMAFLGPGQAALSTVAASALVVRRFERRRSIAVGILNGGDNLLNSGLYYLAAVLLTVWGWRGTIASLGSLYLALALLVLWALRAPRAAAGDAAARGSVSLRDVPWRDARLWLVCLTYALIYSFITSVQLHLHAFLTDVGHAPLEASRILSTLTLVGAAGAPLFGWLAERRSARDALVVVVIGLAVTSVALWTTTDLGALTVWAVCYGLVNSGVVALLALVLTELFGADRIGRLMGVAIMFCMSATMVGNNFSAAIFDHSGSYTRAWQTYTALMLLTLPPVLWLRRQAAHQPDTAAALPRAAGG